MITCVFLIFSANTPGMAPTYSVHCLEGGKKASICLSLVLWVIQLNSVVVQAFIKDNALLPC